MKPPGGGTTATPAMASVGAVRSTTVAAAAPGSRRERRARLWVLANPASPARVAASGFAGASSTRSMPVSVTVADTRVPSAGMSAPSALSGPSSASRRSSITGHAVTSTIALAKRWRNPASTRSRTCPSANSARRRGPWATTTGARATSSPRRANAAATISCFQARYVASSRCWAAQPPHTPKCGQTGWARPGPSASRSTTRAARPPPRAGPSATRTRSPGTVKGTNRRAPSLVAMPSPSAPSRSIVTVVSSPAMALGTTRERIGGSEFGAAIGGSVALLLLG